MRRNARWTVAIVAAMASFAGCQAPAPLAPASETTHATFELRDEPLRAAGCIARNVDRYRSPYSARIVAGVAPAVAQVIVSGREVVATAQLFVAGNASTAQVEAAPIHGRDELVAAMVEGC